jgi:hypothetical protein
MGTLYDLLGALPSDDAEELRTAFRKAAKTTHPDINPDDPEAALRFRELVRAYDILTDAEQRTTYDQLLAIAVQRPASKSTRVYETVRKVASNTMVATIISGVLVGGYTLFGQPSKPPSAAEIMTERAAGGSDEIPAATPAAQPEATAQNEPRVQREGANEVTAAAVTTTVNERRALPATGIDPTPTLDVNNLLIRYDPGLAVAYIDRDLVMYRTPEFDRAIDAMAHVKRVTNKRRSKISAPPPPRNISPVIVRAPRMWTPMTAANTH